MLRANESEILEANNIPDELVGRSYRELYCLHRWLGDVRSIVHAIRKDTAPVHRILDVGCGTGLVGEHLGRRLDVEVLGVDIRCYPGISARIPILAADATRDRLPVADVAYSTYLGHHLSETDLEALIRNVGRYCRRFIILDLVRHWMPLALFRLFVAPFLSPVSAEDGGRSLRRSYTPEELREVAISAATSIGATIQCSVAPFYTRQLVDIRY